MKAHPILALGAVFLLACAFASATEPPHQSTPSRVGVYDSRILSFAHFWSKPATQARNALVAEAKMAKASSDTARYQELNALLLKAQRRSHLQVFSTAPADEAMAALKDKLPALQAELGVARVVSSWDETAPLGIAEAERLDVTDRLVREFLPDPTERQRQTIAAMKTTKPLPLAEATQLADAGKL